MSDPVDLQELLNAPGTEFPDRPNLPGNRYVYGKLVSMQAMNSRNKGTPGYHFDVRLTDPGDDWTDADKKALHDAGFSLADYQAGLDFWLTKNAMSMLWRFLESIGFDRSLGLRQTLSLDEKGLPTATTIEKIRGIDIVAKTPMADERGRVFLNNLENAGGTKKTS